MSSKAFSSVLFSYCTFLHHQFNDASQAPDKLSQVFFNDVVTIFVIGESTSWTICGCYNALVPIAIDKTSLNLDFYVVSIQYVKKVAKATSFSYVTVPEVVDNHTALSAVGTPPFEIARRMNEIAIPVFASSISFSKLRLSCARCSENPGNLSRFIPVLTLSLDAVKVTANFIASGNDVWICKNAFFKAGML